MLVVLINNHNAVIWETADQTSISGIMTINKMLDELYKGMNTDGPLSLVNAILKGHIIDYLFLVKDITYHVVAFDKMKT